MLINKLLRYLSKISNQMSTLPQLTPTDIPLILWRQSGSTDSNPNPKPNTNIHDFPKDPCI